MRILAITPIHVSDEELARRQARYDRLAPAGVTVRLLDLGAGDSVPRALDTAEQVAASEAALAERFVSVDVSQVDVFLPDCVLDPVVGSPVDLPRPLHGIARLTAHFVAGTGARMGSVARNEPIAAELDRKLASYGLPLARPTAVLDLGFDAIADDLAWAAAVAGTVADLDCDVVFNACSAVDVHAGTPGPLLLDPTRTALQLLGAQAAAGLLR